MYKIWTLEIKRACEWTQEDREELIERTRRNISDKVADQLRQFMDYVNTNNKNKDEDKTTSNTIWKSS